MCNIVYMRSGMFFNTKLYNISLLVIGVQLGQDKMHQQERVDKLCFDELISLSLMYTCSLVMFGMYERFVFCFRNCAQYLRD